MNAPLSSQTADELRASFDGAFSERHVEPSSDVEELLTLTLGTDAYAVRLSQVAGLYADRKLVPLPSARRELLGIVGLRNTLVPVYDLGALLGYAPLETPRWFVLARAKVRVGFACTAPDTLVRVPRSQISARTRIEGAAQPHLTGAVRIGTVLRPLIDLSSVLALVERLAALQARSPTR
jgi:chemotaxis signal transduction protein